MSTTLRALWAPWAWLSLRPEQPPQWQAGVLLNLGDDGHWQKISCNVNQPPDHSEVLAGPLLPSFVNAHSHAFQRAFAGQTEHQRSPSDDFWSWRDAMYGVALRITPDQLQAIASQLYLELLRGGYTHVCEFHYLNHQSDGTPYQDPLRMTDALICAAQRSGLGLTVLPVLYEQAGIAGQALRPDQRRFKQSAQAVWAAAQTINQRGVPLVNAGLAIHSVRAASRGAIRSLLDLAQHFLGPIHIHVAEQTAEIDDCLKHHGARPIQWLAQERFLDARWHLVHATHTTPEEVRAAAASGARLVLCPSTEGNLGDGLCDLPGWLDASVPMTIGSDSHASRDALEELRWLEYGQRLHQRKRTVAASAALADGSTAQRLLAGVRQGAASAAGLSDWGLCEGARADALMLNLEQASLLGVPQPHWLDALVFSSPSEPWRDVMVAGQWVIQQGQHAHAQTITEDFQRAMQELQRSTLSPTL
jgi:formimidoylglutamate deiminase